MALFNFGIVPAGGTGTVGQELSAVTRRAVMPAVVVQIGKSTVTETSMLASAELVTGGVSPMTIPVQGTRMVQGAWTGYAGNFSAPGLLPGIANAEYNLSAFVVGIPYYLFEGLVQEGADIVPLVWPRMNDAGNYVSDQLATALFAALSANTSLMPFSLMDVMATTDPTQGALGNLGVASFGFWKANVAAITAISSTAAWGRTNVMAAIAYAQKNAGGEPPTCGVCSPGAWMALAADYATLERYMVGHEGSYADDEEGARSYFPALNVGTVPIYADLYYPDNTTLALPNFNYLSYKLHRDAAFAVAGPESLLPQFQLGYVMALFVLISVVCSKRGAQAKITAFTGAYTI